MERHSMASRTELPSFTLTAAELADFERQHPGDLQRGYRSGLAGEAVPRGASPAFEHGHQCGVIDLG
jgi:hypothetical protein